MRRNRIVTVFAVLILALFGMAAVACGKPASKPNPQKPSYTVTFDLNYEGAPNGGVYKTSKVTQGNTVAEPAKPTRSGGYTFVEWTESRDGTGKWSFTKAISGDKTLYAQWKQEQEAATLESITVTYSGKAEYNVGEQFDYSALVVKAKYSDTSEVTLNSTDYTLSEFEMTAGVKTVTVTYKGKTDDFTFTVKEDGPEVTLSSITVTPPDKVVYNVGEELVLDGITVTAHYSDESEEEIEVDDCTVTGYDKTKSGEQTVTVEYQDKTDTFDVTVNKVYFAVTFAKNTDYDVTGMPVAQNIEDGSNAVRPSAAPYCKGFIFDGWYHGGEEWDFENDPVTQAIELTAKWTAKSYTVKYMVTGGDDPATQVYTAVEGVFGTFELATPQKEHHAFDGWYMNSGFSGDKKSELTYADIADAAEIILYGKFTADTYTISYDFGGSADTFEAKWADGFAPVTSYSYGERVTLPTAANIVITAAQDSSAVYNFAGWLLDGNTIGDIKNTDFGNKALVARITADPIYTVTYDHNYTGGPTVTRQVVKNGTAIELTPTRTGYTFDKWYKESGCINAYDFDTETVTGPITLYAGWTVNTYRVTFYPIGGVLSGDGEVVVQYDNTVTKPTDPTREGYTFTGWVTNIDTGAAYDFTTPVTADLKLYATWKINEYTVTFDAKGGTFGGETTVKVKHGETITAPALPTMTGYTFEGWYTDDVTFSKKWSFAEGKVTGAVTLYAHYNVIVYTVVYETGDGSGNAQNPTSYKITDEDFTLEAATAPTGYRFVEWRSALENGDVITALDADIISRADADNTIKIYAVYSDEYTVTFDAAEGTLAAGTTPKTVKRGEKITAPENPTRSGFAFIGWKAENAQAMWDFAADVMPAADLKLCAVWHENPKDGTYLFGTMTDWGNGVGDIKATVDAQGIKKEYTVTGVALKKGDEFILVSYDEDGNATEYIKAPANFTVYGADGIITLVQSDVDDRDTGNYCVTEYAAAYEGMTWTIVLGVNDYGQNIVSFTLERDSSLRDPNSGNADESVHIVTPVDGAYYLVGNFSGGFKPTDAWVLDDNARVKVIDGVYYFTDVYLKKLDAFKVFVKTGETEQWYGGHFVDVGKKISLGTDIQADIDLGVGFEDGLYNIVLELGEHKSVTVYKKEQIGATLIPTVVYVGDTLTKSDLAVTNHGEPITDYTLIAPIAVSGTNTVTVIYNGNVVTLDYQATDVVATAVEITTQPTKLAYKVGDELSLAGIRVKVTYNKPDTTTTVGADKLTASIARFTAAGDTEITVTLDGTTLTAKFTVEVENKLTSVEITTAPTKTVYYEDDTAIELDGMIVTARYNEGIDGATVINDTVTDYTTNARAITFDAGEKTLTVAYGGLTDDVKITVTALEIVSVSVDTTNATVDYKLGDMFSTAGMSASATYNSGKTKTIAVSEFTFKAGVYLNVDNMFIAAKNGINVTATHTSGKTSLFTVNVAPLTVTLDANGGTLGGEGTIAVTMYGDNIAEPTEPMRANYDFVEWRHGGKAWNFAADGVTSDITLTAAWTPKTYSVTFEWGDGAYTASWIDGYTAPTGYTFGTGLTLPDASKINVSTDGYNFLGWYAEGNTDEHVTAISTADSGNKTFVAHIEQADTVEFVFDFNYDDKKETVNVVIGTSATEITEPTREGYTFGGWYVDRACNGNKWVFTDKVTETTTVYAAWSINSYDVTFVYGYDDLTSKKSIEYGAKIAEPTKPQREGYTFGGWFNGETEWSFSTDTMPASALTLTAKWTVNKYKVTFVNGDETSETTVDFGAKITEPAKPQRDGYTFDGWFNGETEWSFNTDTMPASALTLTAKWTAITYYVEYVNGTTDRKSYTIEDFPIALEDATVADESKKFVGWYTAEVGGDKIENEIAFADFGGHTDNTLTLYALFETKTYTVTFDVNGGVLAAGEQSKVTVEHGKTVAEPIEPTRENYEFAAWKIGEEEYDFATPVKADITLTAEWTMTTRADGVYANDKFVKALVPDGDSTTKLKAENANLPAGSSITFWKDNAQITKNVYVRGGLTNGEMTGTSYSNIKVVKGGWFNIYYNPSDNSWENGLWVNYIGEYVAPECKDGDGLYNGANKLIGFEVNTDGANEVMAEDLELTEATIITVKYNGEDQTVTIKSDCTLGTVEDGKIKLESGVYSFYYSYAVNEVWISGTPDVPVDPNILLTYEDVGANGSSAGWLVGKFAESGIASFDFAKGYRMTKRLDNNVEQWYIERVYLSVGDEVKVRAGSRGYYENGTEVANTFSRGCSYIRGGDGKANVTTTSGEWDSAGNGNIKINKAGYYTFYFKQVSDGTGPNIWLAYSAT